MGLRPTAPLLSRATLNSMSFVGRYLLRPWVAYAVLCAGLVLTVLLTYYVTRTTRAADDLRFHTAIDETRHLVQIRLDTYVELLRAGSALFAASDAVTPAEFSRFAARLEVDDRYPGIQGVGFARYLRPG